MRTSDAPPPPRQLPWPTVRGPLAWVPWVAGGCIVVGVASFVGAGATGLAGHPALDLWVFFLGVVFFAVLTFEGYHTGVVHTRRGVVRYSSAPVRFAIALGTYTLLSATAVMLFFRLAYLTAYPL